MKEEQHTQAEQQGRGGPCNKGYDGAWHYATDALGREECECK